jgi:hypothetical protein
MASSSPIPTRVRVAQEEALNIFPRPVLGLGKVLRFLRRSLCGVLGNFLQLRRGHAFEQLERPFRCAALVALGQWPGKCDHEFVAASFGIGELESEGPTSLLVAQLIVEPPVQVLEPCGCRKLVRAREVASVACRAARLGRGRACRGRGLCWWGWPSGVFQAAWRMGPLGCWLNSVSDLLGSTEARLPDPTKVTGEREMLAISTMGAGWTALFYGIAFVAAGIAAFFSWPWRQWHFMLAVALAAFFFVQVWNALAAT